MTLSNTDLEPAEPVRVDTDDALGTSDAVELQERLSRGEVSAAELRAAATARAEQVNDALNAVACWVPEPDVSPSVEGPFAGIPTLLKDNEHLGGYPTRFGSRAVSAEPDPRTTTWTEQFLDLGFDPIAKTTLPEFGLTATTESVLVGPTRNPWHPGYSSGGSSGGSAALVAAGVVPLAHANDGGGSIRIPAACCGLVGLKPSRGRIIDVPERAKMPVNNVTQGVVTRTVRDTAAYFAAAETKYHNTELPPVGHIVRPGTKRLRIGLHVDSVLGGWIDPEVERTTRNAAALCAELGHDVVEIPGPYDEQFARDFLRYWQFLAAAVQRFGGKILRTEFDPDLTEDFTKELSRMFVRQIATAPAAIRRLRRHAERPDPVFDDLDVVISPVLTRQPPPIGYLGPEVEPRTHLIRLLRFAQFTIPMNITGGPAMSLPLGHSRRGLPIGVQFSAPLGEERRLLKLALEIEEAAPWHMLA